MNYTLIYFSQFWRLGSPRSRYLQIQCLVRTLVCRWPLSHFILTGKREKELVSLSLSLFKSSSKDSFFIGLEKGQKRKKHCERETSNGCLPYTPGLGNRTCNPGLCPDHKWTCNVLVINQLSHISQGSSSFYKDIYSILRVPPSWPNLTLITSQRSHPQSHWRLELQHMNWGWVHKLTVYST